eukprot:GHVH01016053.1.p1 GENE.GHVH01016053.1~~GHVH01016053.1.p1  ORF type:complete len:135 (-),score=15.05 GHVH01016053.1:504-908(-)
MINLRHKLPAASYFCSLPSTVQLPLSLNNIKNGVESPPSNYHLPHRYATVGASGSGDLTQCRRELRSEQKVENLTRWRPFWGKHEKPIAVHTTTRKLSWDAFEFEMAYSSAWARPQIWQVINVNQRLVQFPDMP